jgi:DNA-binding transcriptional MerR regulator
MKTAEALRFTAEEVCDLANVTYRQLDHWTRTGHIEDPRPPELHGSGYGRVRTYTLVEAFEVSNMGALIRAGFRVEAAANLASAHRRPHWETA